ncbi:MAG: hypothetical protein JW941_10595 [Candidatus Coatesbacteria bacterium]|nr:hypothetical protein [Candidatus Coatesbacteria bacterium]
MSSMAPEMRVSIVERLRNIDRRVIFVLVAAAVIIPLLHPLGLPLKSSPPSSSLYREIENLGPGSVVLMAFDYDPATDVELGPMSLALLKHCFSRGHKVVSLALWPMGASLARASFAQTAEEFGAKYGVDYVNLGFKAGGIVVIDSLGKSIHESFPKDVDGTPLEELPLMRNINSYADIDFVLGLSAGDPGLPFWIMIAQGRYGKKVGGGCTAVSAPMLYPYYPNQLLGLLGGMKGAAEYELLIEAKGSATKGMDAQSIAHALIVLFVIIGNLFYFMGRSREKRGGQI